jgi:hexosaminidase
VGSLNATTMFGALRGLETLAQLLDLYGVATTARQISHAPVHVSDAPRFSYRGLLIDSGRHFLPVASIKAVIDAMAYNKLNVLHWHIVDASAFPCGSVAFPELAAQGAYDPSAIYSVEDLADVVAYAKARAVRVLPEWDVPGHGRWGAVPGIMGCSDVLDPTADKTYEFLATFLGEMAGIFEEKWMFLGGDEVDSTCWDQNPKIAAWLRDHAMNSSQLQQYFWRQLEARVLPGLNKTIGVWEADGLQISLDSLAQGMFVNVYQGLETSNKTVWANKTTVLSIAGDWWYLDQLGCGGYHQSGWTCTYDVDLAPPSFNYGPEQLALMKGGETAMWGEGINKDNAAQYIWRGAAAAAERLWSAQARTPSHSQATERFQEHLCRLAMLGVRAGPIGPNFCPADAQAPMAAAALTALNALASSSETETVALSRAQFEAVRSALQLAAASGF